jgi:hypothetical protein
MRGDVVSQSGERLKSGQLGTADVTASTVANIGPGIDFYFGSASSRQPPVSPRR